MSIEMENPETTLEMVDALTNLVEQMFLAHQIKDERMFKIAYERAAELGFTLLDKMVKQEP